MACQMRLSMGGYLKIPIVLSVGHRLSVLVQFNHIIEDRA